MLRKYISFVFVLILTFNGCVSSTQKVAIAPAKIKNEYTIDDYNRDIENMKVEYIKYVEGKLHEYFEVDNINNTSKYGFFGIFESLMENEQ